MKTYKECCAEVSRNHRLGKKEILVTGHRAVFFEEAAKMYADQFKNEIIKLEQEIQSLHEAAAGEDI